MPEEKLFPESELGDRARGFLLEEDLFRIGFTDKHEPLGELLRAVAADARNDERKKCAAIAEEVGRKANQYVSMQFSESSKWLQQGKVSAAEEIRALILSRGRSPGG